MTARRRGRLPAALLLGAAGAAWVGPAWVGPAWVGSAWVRPAWVRPAWAQPVKRPEPPGAATLPPYPERLPAWRRDTVIDYEARPGGAGLGSSANYMPLDGGGGAATFYVYDRGRRDLADGVDGAAVAELGQALREVELAAAHRQYRVAARRDATPVTAPDGRPVMRCAAMTLEFQSGGVRTSLACVGVLGGRFVKLRLTRPVEAPGDPEKLAHGFGRAMLAALALPGK